MGVAEAHAHALVVLVEVAHERVDRGDAAAQVDVLEDREHVGVLGREGAVGERQAAHRLALENEAVFVDFAVDASARRQETPAQTHAPRADGHGLRFDIHLRFCVVGCRIVRRCGCGLRGRFVRLFFRCGFLLRRQGFGGGRFRSRLLGAAGCRFGGSRSERSGRQQQAEEEDMQGSGFHRVRRIRGGTIRPTPRRGG